MKKVFTIILAFAAITSASAQWQSKNDDRNRRDDDYVYNKNHKYEKNDGRGIFKDKRNEENSSYSVRERDAEINRINREYAARINRIENASYLKKGERNKQIRRLEQERKEEIRIVYSRYENRRDRNNDRQYGKDYNSGRRN